MFNKVLFLDRDGPINIVGPKGFIHKPKYFHFTEGIFKICREAMSKDYKIIIITNQTGIGLGDYTEKDVEDVHEHMLRGFKKEGVKITDIFYTRNPTSPNRKPSPGMFMLAKEKYELSDKDMFMSFSIGDRKKDAEAALRAGIGNIIYYQTNKALDSNWQIINRTPIDLVQEIDDIKKEFQTLLVLGALAKAEKLEQEPKIIVRQAPKMLVINHYDQMVNSL